MIFNTQLEKELLEKYGKVYATESIATRLRISLMERDGIIRDYFVNRFGYDSKQFNDWRYFLHQLPAVMEAYDKLDPGLPCFDNDIEEVFDTADRALEAMEALKKEIINQPDGSIEYFNKFCRRTAYPNAEAQDLF